MKSTQEQIAAHGAALHGIEDLVAFMPVDVEIHGGRRLPVVSALLALFHARALLVHLPGIERGGKTAGLGIGRLGREA